MNSRPRLQTTSERKARSQVTAPPANTARKVMEKNREAAQLVNSVSAEDADYARKNARAMELSLEAIKITVEDVNKKLAPTGTSVQFKYHEQTGRYSFKILDNEGAIIREVPPEKSLDMVAKMFELAGILVDERL
jgi:flagellar protein FlaG